MIPPPVRIACALVGVVLLAVAGFDRNVPVMIAGALFLLPATFGGGRTRAGDLQRLETSIRLFRSASLLCFGAALGLYAIVLSMKDRLGAMAQQAGILGAAFWLVALLLLFLFAFYASRRRALVRAR